MEHNEFRLNIMTATGWISDSKNKIILNEFALGTRWMEGIGRSGV